VPSDYLLDLRDRLREFARERDWEQFHTPKNLTSALAVEAAELLEHFQWMPSSPVEGLSDEKQQQIGEEIADVLIYLVRLADVLTIDVISATDAKLAKNALKYPVALARGKSAKYSDL
jgi:dCTP diphosphatase